MNHYEQSKKARRVASVVYLVVLAVILGGTYISQQNKAAAKAEVSVQPVMANSIWKTRSWVRVWQSPKGRVSDIVIAHILCGADVLAMINEMSGYAIEIVKVL